MNAGQYQGLIGRLDEILSRMPEREKRTPAAPSDLGGPLGAAGQRGAHRALKRLLDVLDGWIEGARINHEALGHRGEPVGSECWTQFHPDDIRNMINDAAREIGVAEPWTMMDKEHGR